MKEVRRFFVLKMGLIETRVVFESHKNYVRLVREARLIETRVVFEFKIADIDRDLTDD